MYFKVENSGVATYKDKVQIRYCLYLEEKDKRYAEFYIDKPIIPEKGYDGKPEDYQKWIASLPTQKTLIPYHNHFCYFSPSVTDAEILYIGDVIVETLKKSLDADTPPYIKNDPVMFASTVNISVKQSCDTKVAEIKVKKLGKDG